MANIKIYDDDNDTDADNTQVTRRIRLAELNI